MGYKKEIGDKIKSNLDGALNYYTITVGKGYAVVEGHKGVLNFDGGSVSIRLKKGKAVFSGKDLRIASSQKDEIVIEGAISEISLDGAE